MWQMYIRGKLLFVGYIFSGHTHSVRDLQKQISKTRGDYRLGRSLPSDYKYRYNVIYCYGIIYEFVSIHKLNKSIIVRARVNC